MLRLLTLTLSITFAGSLAADPLPEFWQKQREVADVIGDRACEGDQLAIEEVRDRLEMGEPVMMNNISWLKANCDVFSDTPISDVVAYQEKSASLGYPIALHNMGYRLMTGENYGKDPKAAVEHFERAAAAGYGRAAAQLAAFFISGEHLPQDLERAKELLELAEAEGVSAQTLEKHRASLAAADPGAKSANTSTAQQNGDQFAALAVSLGDRGFGFAHDYPTRQEAQSRAMDECRSRGGADCELKMVGQGKGCMAYHYAGASATAHGWAIGQTQSEVESRAAEECRVRNGNATCNGTAWVCNDRTNAELVILQNTPMPEIPVTAENMCNVFFSYSCVNKDEGDIFSPIYYATSDVWLQHNKICAFYVDGSNDGSSLVYDFGANDWREGSSRRRAGGVSSELRNQFAGLLKEWYQHVRPQFPSCTNDHAMLTIHNAVRAKRIRGEWSEPDPFPRAGSKVIDFPR